MAWTPCLKTRNSGPAQAGSGPATLECSYMGSLVGKWQWVIGICKWHGQTGYFNNQDLEEKELNLMERKKQTAQGANYWNQRKDAQLSREPAAGLEGGWAIGWVCFTVQPSPFQIPMLGASPSYTPSQPSPLLSRTRHLFPSGPQHLSARSPSSLLTALIYLVSPSPDLPSSESSETPFRNRPGSHQSVLEAPCGLVPKFIRLVHRQAGPTWRLLQSRLPPGF